ncbi:MAG: PEP-CTERM/exosortase system-associated acyltransferase [Chromatiales bacterium]|jgi:N-acyl amino acid synthase of PEP-CTERM/exosortase system
MTSQSTEVSVERPDRTVRTAYFEFLSADGRMELLDESYQLRYQVYCIERGFLNQCDYPEGRECDNFDRQSAHFVGRHRATQLYAGTARLVHFSEKGFPMMSHCTLDREYKRLRDIDNPELRRCGEVSRVAVSKLFRHRAADTRYGGPPRQDKGAGAIPSASLGQSSHVGAYWPEIVSGLYKSIYQEAKRNGLSTLIVAMERSLYVLLKRMQIRFQPIGPEVDYHGPVRPYMLSIKRGEIDIAKRAPLVLVYLLQGLEPELWPECTADLDLSAMTGDPSTVGL